MEKVKMGKGRRSGLTRKLVVNALIIVELIYYSQFHFLHKLDVDSKKIRQVSVKHIGGNVPKKKDEVEVRSEYKTPSNVKGAECLLPGKEAGNKLLKTPRIAKDKNKSVVKVLPRSQNSIFEKKPDAYAIAGSVSENSEANVEATPVLYFKDEKDLDKYVNEALGPDTGSVPEAVSAPETGSAPEMVVPERAVASEKTEIEEQVKTPHRDLIVDLALQNLFFSQPDAPYLEEENLEEENVDILNKFFPIPVEDISEQELNPKVPKTSVTVSETTQEEQNSVVSVEQISTGVTNKKKNIERRNKIKKRVIWAISAVASIAAGALAFMKYRK